MTLSSDRLSERKRALRQRAGQLRDLAAEDARRDLSPMEADLGEILQRHGCRVLGGYHPIRSEFDVLPLMDAARRAGLETALPVVTAHDQALEFRSWRAGEPLRRASFDVSVPLDDAPVLAPDILLVPGLAFDRQGGRLGYGGGFYDRTIKALAEQGRAPVTVGICYKEQIVETVPREAHDQTLDYVLFA